MNEILIIGIFIIFILFILTIPIFVILVEKYLFRYWDWLDRKINDW